VRDVVATPYVNQSLAGITSGDGNGRSASTEERDAPAGCSGARALRPSPRQSKWCPSTEGRWEVTTAGTILNRVCHPSRRDYATVHALRAEGLQGLAMHPTVKPVACCSRSPLQVHGWSSKETANGAIRNSDIWRER
jgi:hypothetical protein